MVVQSNWVGFRLWKKVLKDDYLKRVRVVQIM